MAKTHEDLNPAAIQRQVQALTFELLTIRKAAARQKFPVARTSKRAIPDEPVAAPLTATWSTWAVLGV